MLFSLQGECLPERRLMTLKKLGLIARSIRDLIPGQIKDKSLTDWILHLVALRNNKYDQQPKQFKFKFATVALNLETDQQETVLIPKQEAKLVIYEIKVLGNVLVEKAEQLSEVIRHINSPRDAVDFFTSPKIFDNDGLIDWANAVEESDPLVEWYRQQVVI